MEIIEIFQVLGIEQTKDEGAIKKAYREKLAVTNPEDNPEGFKRLRTAYEEACNYARQAEEDAQEGEQRDDTPSGLWLEKVGEIYSSIDRRRDAACWEALFEEDIFLSLEEEENCRGKLFRFLMEHYKLPTDVWKLLDQKLDITASAPKLREQFPVDFVNYMVAKCERGEDVDFTQFEGQPDASYDLFLQYYDRCWQVLQENQLEQAAEYIKNADDLLIYHPVMEICRASLLEKQEKTEEAIALLLQLQKRFSEDAMVGYHAAEMLWKYDRKQEAAALYEGLKALNQKHYMANVRLSEWYYECGRYQDAKACAEEVLSLGSDDRFVALLGRINHELEKTMEKDFRRDRDWRTGMDLCWCYLQDGKITKGLKLAGEIEKQIPEEKHAEYNGLLTKLYVEAAEFEECLSMADVWEKSLYEKMERDETKEEIEKDKDRIRQSHLIRMQCYRSLGYADKQYFEKAIQEIEGIETGSSRDIGLLLEKAQICMEMEEYEKSLELVRRLIEDYQVYAAYATAQEVYRRMWNAQGVVQSGRQCIQHFPGYGRAYEHIAKVYLDLKYTEDLKALLEEAKQNQVESVMLEAYAYQMEHEIPNGDVLDERVKEFRENYLAKVEEGKLEYYEKGLPLITEYLCWFPGSYMLVERGIFHKAANHMEEAKADYERALAENPSNPYALNGLHHVYRALGEYDKSLVCLRKAMLYLGEEKSPVSYADLGNLYSLLGHYELALKSYQQFVEHAGEKVKTNTYYMRRMAMCMARCGQTEEAIALLEGAFSVSFDRYDEQVNIYQVCGEAKKAAKLLEKWHKELKNSAKYVKNAEYARYYDRAAWQALMFGSGKTAVEIFEKELKLKGPGDRIGGTLCDTVFACILCGEEEKGKLYSAKLRDWQVKEKEEGRNDYYQQDKGRLELDFLAAYYVKSIEELDALLAKEDNCLACHFCTFCICKELEGVRILHMLRKGQQEAAFERLERNLEAQPLDEYMIAIKHMCEDGVKVVPEKEALSNGAANAGEAADKAVEKASDGEAEESNSRVDYKASKGLLGKMTGILGIGKKQHGKNL